MSGSRRWWLAAGGALVFLILSAPLARADLVTTLTVSQTPDGDGLFDYQYNLTNQSNSTLSVIQFFFQVSTTADLQSVSGPVGWDIVYSPGDATVDWESPDSSTDLAPGQTGVFSFKSALDSTPQPYTIFGLNEVNFDLGSNSGFIASPTREVSAAVPEPASLTLLGIGAVGVLGYAWRQKHRG